LIWIKAAIARLEQPVIQYHLALHTRVIMIKAAARLPRKSILENAGPLVAITLLAFMGTTSPQGARAQSTSLTGKEVVDAVCANCHATGAKGSPKIGDHQAWSKRASRGLSSLTANALKGIRQMPSHGGNQSLSDLEIKRAIAYMVNQSGGKWTEPVDKRALPAPRTGEQIVKAQCIKCHESGKGGAPKIGDRDAWIPRLKDGLDNTVRSAINGHGGMPARGGMANLTDSEMRSAVIYLFRGPATAN
jgi:cytochrome c5